MNIFIITIGSRGDVQPYVALGKGLQAAGHNVTVATSNSFESFITDHGLTYGYLSNDLLDLLDPDLLDKAGNLFGMIKTAIEMSKVANRINEKLLYESWETAQQANPDMIIYHPKALAGPHMAEKLNIPVALALPVPATVPTHEFPALGMPNLGLGGWYNKLTYNLVAKGYSAYDKTVNAFREQSLGLEPMKGAAMYMETSGGNPIPVLHAHSQYVAPRPADWNDYAYVTGYWFLDRLDDWQASAELRAFLNAGEPPIYAGFGSMSSKNPQKLAHIVIEAMKQANVRGVIATGWGGLDAATLPDTVFKIDHAPHDWLFPRMAAVVHHGGAGTTAAGLHAGCPTIIAPFIADQPYWGAHIHRLGVGPKPIHHKKLTVDKLAAALREVTTNPSMKEKAAKLGEKIRQEDGIANAIAIIEKLLSPVHS